MYSQATHYKVSQMTTTDCICSCTLWCIGLSH